MHLTKTESLILDQFIQCPGTELHGTLIVTNDSSITMGSVYVMLKRLENKGFLTSKREKMSAGVIVPKRLYTLTVPGRRYYLAAKDMQQRLQRLAEECFGT